MAIDHIDGIAAQLPPSSAQRAFSMRGVGTLVQWGLGRMFGTRVVDPQVAPGDIGLVGPAGASWRLLAEPAAIAGGIRGLFVQVAHPLAMAGVADHSEFRVDPLGRLQRTSQYVTVSTYGSTAEALAIASRVRAIHRRVRGVASDGRPYRADDPHLLAWVSLALTSSFLVADRLWAPAPLSVRDADRFVAEQSTLAALLDPRVDLNAIRADRDAIGALRCQALPLPMLTERLLPATVEELDEAFARYAPELGIDHAGRDAVRFLRRPPIPIVARVPYRTIMRGAIASLSPVLRDALDVEAPRRPDAALQRVRMLLNVVRAVSGTSPSEQLAAQRTALLSALPPRSLPS